MAQEFGLMASGIACWVIIGSMSGCSGIPSAESCSSVGGAGGTNPCLVSGGSFATGGAASNAGFSTSGGTVSSGGLTATGGLPSSSGAAAGGATSTSTGGTTGNDAGLVCEPGKADCDKLADNGCETDLRSDPKHCSACNLSCGASYPNYDSQCVAGVCIDGCKFGFANCDALIANGCETNLTTDNNNCGSCGSVCSSPGPVAATCNRGTCQIWSPYADCDGIAANGAETYLLSDDKNCGACGNVCPSSTPTCTQGACVAAGK